MQQIDPYILANSTDFIDGFTQEVGTFEISIPQNIGNQPEQSQGGNSVKEPEPVRSISAPTYEAKVAVANKKSGNSATNWLLALCAFFLFCIIINTMGE